MQWPGQQQWWTRISDTAEEDSMWNTSVKYTVGEGWFDLIFYTWLKTLTLEFIPVSGKLCRELWDTCMSTYELSMQQIPVKATEQCEYFPESVTVCLSSAVLHSLKMKV